MVVARETGTDLLLKEWQDEINRFVAAGHVVRSINVYNGTKNQRQIIVAVLDESPGMTQDDVKQVVTRLTGQAAKTESIAS